MDKNSLKSRIGHLIDNGSINHTNANLINYNIDKIMQFLSVNGVTLCQKNADEKILEACEYICVIYSQEFKEAFNKSGKRTQLEFYKEWCKQLTINCNDRQFTMTVGELYTTLYSTEFKKTVGQIQPTIFLNNKYSTEQAEQLFAFINGIGAAINDSDTSLESIFDSIVSAGELRKLLASTAVEDEVSAVLDEICSVLHECVFKGVSSCTIQLNESLKCDVNDLCNKLAEYEFIASISSRDRSRLIVKAESFDGNYNEDYTEEQLDKLLTKQLGSVYFFVATYCDKVIVPKMINEAVDEISEKLNNVTKDDFTIIVKKKKTRTHAYEMLIRALINKEFNVTEKGDTIIIGW